MKKWMISFLLVSLFVSTLHALELPAPQKEGWLPVGQALSERHAGRDFSNEAVSLQDLSNILWAACGPTRPGHLTIPTAHNIQNIDVYVFTADGIWRYDPATMTLLPEKEGDHRGLTGFQDFVATAPLNLLYIADKAKYPAFDPDLDYDSFSFFHAGAAAQNVALYCTGAGLENVVRGSFHPDPLREALNLPATQFPVIAQSIGHPKAAE